MWWQIIVTGLGSFGVGCLLGWMICDLEKDKEKSCKEEKLSELVFQALGEASMCWEVMPHSEFDSTHATEIGDKLITDLKELFANG